MRESCRTCWEKYGRDLWKGCCLCTGSVLTPTQFYAWSAGNVPKVDLRPAPPHKLVEEQKTRIVFGQKPDKPKKGRAPKKV